MKFFLSKYALTGGIKEVEGKMMAGDMKGFVYAKLDGYENIYVIGRDVHEIREAAVEAAETMRKRKIASLQKQIAKLEKLSF